MLRMIADIESQPFQIVNGGQRKFKRSIKMQFLVRVVLMVFLFALNVADKVIDEIGPNLFVITSTSKGSGVQDEIGKNSQFNFPIFLNQAKCFEIDFVKCKEISATKCCQELHSTKSHGLHNSVSNENLCLISILFPFVFLTFRMCFLGRVKEGLFFISTLFKCSKNESVEKMSNQQCWSMTTNFHSCDAIFGLFSSLTVSALVTNISKVLVGRPRPNYYAYKKQSILFA